MDRQLQAQGFRIITLGPTSTIGRVTRLRRFLTEERPDLIHTTIIESDIVGRMAAVGTGIPVVTSVVNTSYSPARLGDPQVSRWKLSAVKAIDGFTARHLTAGFHALTDTVATATARELRVPRSAITVIPRGRDFDRLGQVTHQRRTAVRRVLGIDEHDQVVLTVGRQEYQKGHVVLVEAAARLAATRPNLKILIAGRVGSQSKAIRDRIRRLNLVGVVEPLDHRDDVPDLFAAADLFAFPSLFEGFGGSLLEAMAMGLPAVVSDLPVFHEVAGSSVQYAPTNDAHSWADAMADLLDDPQARDRLGASAKSRARRMYDVEDVADAYEIWYRQFVSSKA